MRKIEVLGLQTMPQIEQGDNLGEIIVKCSNDKFGCLEDRDIIVLTSKIVTKGLGRTRRLSKVLPGKQALEISARMGRDARWLQMIFDTTREIAVTIRGFKYPINEAKNILNRIAVRSGDAQLGKAIRATALAHWLKKRLLPKVVSWFV